jgi:predicted RNase H-like HicB family nuclease
MKLEIEAEFWREGSQYVARANPMNVLTCGDTREEAEHALEEAVELFLETAREIGTLDDVLVECGYVAVGGKWVVESRRLRSARRRGPKQRQAHMAFAAVHSRPVFRTVGQFTR